MGNKTKTIKVSAHSTKGWFTRPIFVKSMEDVIEEQAEKGYVLISNTPVTDKKGKTSHFILTFRKF